MLKKIVLKISMTCCLLALCSIFALEATVTRVALDVGSGSLKATAAEVDAQAGKIHKIVYAKDFSVPLKMDMEIRGQPYFSERIQQVALDTLAKLQHDLSKYQLDEWSGIATEASRQSQNAQELYDKIYKELGINIRIITQTEEGRLGFSTAAAASGIPTAQLVSLDSGSASFQVTTEIDGQLEIVEGQLGNTPALAVLVSEMRNQKVDGVTSPNPVTLDEAVQMNNILKQRIPKLSDAFKTKLAHPDTVIVGFGAPTHIFGVAELALGKSAFTREELWSAIVEHCGLRDEQLGRFHKPSVVLIRLILLHSYMEGLGINKITTCYSNGSCEGLLVDPAYWTIKE